jgi:hypothetical protein
MHSFAVVLLPLDTVNIRKAVKRLIAKYDQNLITHPSKKYLPAWTVEHYAWHYQTGVDRKQLALKLRPQYDDAGVDDDGVWVVTDMNVDSRWDYWLIGGGFDGLVRGHEVHAQCREEAVESLTEEEYLSRNVCPVVDMPEDVIPFSLVTPDGDWFSEGDLGWSLLEAYGEGTYRGKTKEAEQQWPRIARSLLEKHLDCIAVGLDVHS